MTTTDTTNRDQVSILRAALGDAIKCMETLNTIRHIASDFPALDNARKAMLDTAPVAAIQPAGDAMEYALKLSLGVLASHDMSEAKRIAAIYRKAIAAHPAQVGKAPVPHDASELPIPSVEAALRQIIEADDNQALTQQLIEVGRAALARQSAPSSAVPGLTDEQKSVIMLSAAREVEHAKTDISFHAVLFDQVVKSVPTTATSSKDLASVHDLSSRLRYALDELVAAQEFPSLQNAISDILAALAQAPNPSVAPTTATSSKASAEDWTEADRREDEHLRSLEQDDHTAMLGKASAECQFPLCKGEAEQQQIASDVHAELYGKASAPAGSIGDDELRKLVPLPDPCEMRVNHWTYASEQVEGVRRRAFEAGMEHARPAVGMVAAPGELSPLASLQTKYDMMKTAYEAELKHLRARPAAPDMSVRDAALSDLQYCAGFDAGRMAGDDNEEVIAAVQRRHATALRALRSAPIGADQGNPA